MTQPHHSDRRLPNATRRTHVLRFIADELPPDEHARLEARLADDPALQEEVRTLAAVRAAVTEYTDAAFDEGFAGRVLQRLPAATEAAQTAERLYEALHSAFLRLAIVVLLLTVGIGLYNASLHPHAGTARSFVEAAVGLPHVSLESAFVYDDGPDE
ncbi:MAG: hypothetical protein GVY12_08185 [Bacteroidetes bacterium]|jgi:anti-sigma factor RsiW|nr:hypothetical protein [Bacteroidota bacterium]